MRKNFFFFFCFVLLSFNFGFSEHINVHVLGYPRSGNHWITFCIQHMLETSLQKNWLQSYDPSRTPPYQTTESYSAKYHHRPKTITENISLNSGKNYLIVIVRNYRECMMRHYKNQAEKIPGILADEYLAFTRARNASNYNRINYFIVFKYFEEWDPETRFLVYYEDLMQNPQKVLKDLIKFLGKDEELADEFMQDFKNLQNQSYNKYQNPESRHSGIHHHTALMPENIILSCDQFIQNQNLDLWEKYLSRYAYEKNN